MQAEDYRKVPEVGVTNPTIDVLRAHRTIRKFEDTQLGLEERDALIDVARRAPTSSFRQQFSIIHVTDVAKRDALAEVAQQPYVGTSKGDLFMFVVDLYRNARIREEAGMDIAPLQRTNLFLAAMEDAVLAAHNMEVAAESMGLGTVYLGSLLRGPANDRAPRTASHDLPDPRPAGGTPAAGPALPSSYPQGLGRRRKHLPEGRGFLPGGPCRI